jgi:putative ABC transport system permease protein
MHILPILSTLRRHRTAATLIVLEIALTCAIICNAVFLIGERLSRIDQPSGVAEEELVRIQLVGLPEGADKDALTKEDLAALSAIPGVRHVALTNQIPFGSSAWNSGLSLEKDQLQSNVNATTYFGSEDLVETLGLRLIAGRDFQPDEYVDYDTWVAAITTTRVPAIIITQAMAERLFPRQNPLGRHLYLGDEPSTVVGIVDRLVRPSEYNGPSEFGMAAVMPIRLGYRGGGNYVLRVDPERRGEALAAAAAAIERNNPSRILLRKQTFEEVRADYFRQDRAMAWLLVSVCAALLVITALGIVGLASFWVQQRTRQIGIRRALGATRRQILRYFQTENFLLATFGIILGMALAYGINMLLMERYELPRLPALFLPLGAATLWVLGQLAVLGPALRAASVPPAVATRTV